MDQNSKSLLKSPFHIELNVAFRKLRELEKLAKEVIDSGWADESRWYPKQLEKEAIGVVVAFESAMAVSKDSDDFPASILAPIKKAIRAGNAPYVSESIRRALKLYLECSLTFRVRQMQDYLEVLRVLLLFSRIDRDLFEDARFTLDEKDFPWICFLYGENPPNIMVDPRKFITTRRFLFWVPGGMTKLIVQAIENESWSDLRDALINVLGVALRPEQVLPILVLLWTIEEYLIAPLHETCNLFHDTKAGNRGRNFRRLTN